MPAADHIPQLAPLYVAYYLIAVNLWTFLLFGWDKMKAEAGGWRVPESTLLFWSFVGGSPAAYAGRAAFRHKTRKQPFTGTLHTIASIQMMAVAFVATFLIAGMPNVGP